MHVGYEDYVWTDLVLEVDRESGYYYLIFDLSFLPPVTMERGQTLLHTTVACNSMTRLSGPDG